MARGSFECSGLFASGYSAEHRYVASRRPGAIIGNVGSNLARLNVTLLSPSVYSPTVGSHQTSKSPFLTRLTALLNVARFCSSRSKRPRRPGRSKTSWRCSPGLGERRFNFIGRCKSGSGATIQPGRVVEHQRGSARGKQRHVRISMPTFCGWPCARCWRGDV